MQCEWTTCPRLLPSGIVARPGNRPQVPGFELQVRLPLNHWATYCVLCAGHKEPLMVKFADGGNKKKLQQYNTWLATNDPDVSAAIDLMKHVTTKRLSISQLNIGQFWTFPKFFYWHTLIANFSPVAHSENFIENRSIFSQDVAKSLAACFFPLAL